MKAWKIILLLSYISIASASAAIITPALPQIQQTFALTSGTAEWVVSIYLIGYMVGQIIYGPLANYLGRLCALRIGLVINLLGIGICLLANYQMQYALLVFGRFVTALGASAGLVCTFILINESLTIERAKQAMSYAVISFTLGIGLAVFLGGVLTEYAKWQDCFWLLLAHGAFMLVSTGCFSEALAARKETSIVAIAKNYWLALGNAKLLTFSCFVGIVSLFSYCYSAAAPLIAQQYLGLNAADYGSWNMVCMVGMCLGGVVASKLLKRYQNTQVLFFAVAMLIALTVLLGMLAAIHFMNPICFFSISAAMYFCTSLLYPAATHTASNAIANKANASGAMNFINMGAAVLGVVIMGYLPIDRLWAYVAIFLGYIAICLLIWYLAKPKFN